MARSITLQQTQAKLQEYMKNGVRLSWLIDHKTRRVEIYRLNPSVEVLENPSVLSGEDVYRDLCCRPRSSGRVDPGAF